MSGGRIAHFEILDELGSGGMGQVFLARDLRLHRTVALKTLSADRPVSEEARKRLLAEARAASALSHPAIVTVYEVGTEEGVDFISMEHVEGRSLDRILSDGPLPTDRVQELALELVAALVEAHSQGVIHRDLKPANVMVTDRGRLKVLDFGLAKRLVVRGAEIVEDLPTVADPVQTAAGTVMGTPAYMAPEQARGRLVGPKSDLFSLGAILFEMLTGRRAFSGASPVDVLSAVLCDDPPAPSALREDLPKDWDGLVRRLLAKDPADRPASAAAVLEELGRLEPGGSARGLSATRRLAPTGAILLLAILGSAWLASRDPRPETAPESSSPSSDTVFPSYRFRLLSDRPGSQREPTLSPDGQLVAFVQEDDDGVPQLWISDLASGSPHRITDGPLAARFPHWDPRGGRIVFARADEGIWEVPVLGGAARQLVERGSKPRLSRDGRLLGYVSDRRPWIADAGGDDPRPLPGFEPTFFGDAAFLEFSPDGERVVVFWPAPNRPLGDLWLAPLGSDSPPRRLTDLGYLPWGSAPIWTADGRWILFASDHSGAVNVWRIPADGGEPRPVTSGAGSDYSPDVSEDLGIFAYANGRQTARIEAFDPASGDHRVVYEHRNLLITPEVSPDGREVAFFTRTPRSFHVFALDLGTGQARQVTHGEGVINNHPTWSADGRWLYFYQQEPTLTYRRVPADGGREEVVLDDWHWSVQNHTRPSPDGRRVVYTERDAGQLVETRIRDLTSGAETVLSRALFGAVWSHDGETVLGAEWRPYGVYRCPPGPGECELLADGGWDLRLGPDAGSFHFLTGSPPVVWSLDLETGESRRLHEVESYDSADFGWGISSSGEILHHAQVASDLEIWIGEAEESDPETAGGSG